MRFKQHLNKRFPRNDAAVDEIDIPEINTEGCNIEKEDIIKAINSMKNKKEYHSTKLCKTLLPTIWKITKRLKT